MRKLVLLISFVASLFAMGKGPALVNTQVVQEGVVNPLQEFVGSVSFAKKI
jgi:hypothetical protein